MIKRKQALNPYLPSWEYIPDGEPHVFGDRVYIYGSHDRFDGNLFCMNDYICYSADVHDLTAWQYEGVIYRKDQDPRNPKGEHCLWAPDVVQGPDGRYYLYYCLDDLPQIGVAVCDAPAGRFEHLGLVKHADGVILGEGKEDYIQFDPGVFIDDDGEIYLYSGNAPRQGSGRENKNSQVMTLEKDMLTIKREPRSLIPTIRNSKGTGFEGHEFFEASSIRKVGNLYYFVYSSVQSHELCYCISDRPDEGYSFGGTLVSIGDVFLNGRQERDALNFLGNTHGGMELIDGQWYIFYHRQTNRTQYSRQGCAEKIRILPDGRIPQVEVTSCGLNGEPLWGKGHYEARIACNLRGKYGIVMSVPERMTKEYPYFTQDREDLEPEAEGAVYVCGSEGDQGEPVQYIANLRDGALVGYKYFEFEDAKEITIRVRPHHAAAGWTPSEEEPYCKRNAGVFFLSTQIGRDYVGKIPVDFPDGKRHAWREFAGSLQIPDGVSALYLEYQGEGALDLLSFELI